MDFSRREYLKGVAGTAAAATGAGCIGSDDNNTAAENPDNTTEEAHELPEGYEEIVEETNQAQQSVIDTWYEDNRFLGIDSDTIETELVPIDGSDDEYRLETTAETVGDFADLSMVKDLQSDDLTEEEKNYTETMAINVAVLTTAATLLYLENRDNETMQSYEDDLTEMSYTLEGSEAGGAQAIFDENRVAELENNYPEEQENENARLFAHYLYSLGVAEEEIEGL